VDELEMKEPLNVYNVPANVRSAVNHGLNAALTADSSVAKEALRIRFIHI